MPAKKMAGQAPAQDILNGRLVWRFVDGCVLPMIAGGADGDAGGAPAAGDKAGIGDKPAGKTDDKAGQVDGEEFDKDRAMATIKKLREFERTAKTQLKELEDLKAAQTKAEEDALKKQGDWQKLHQQEKDRADGLEASKAKAERLEAALAKQLTKEREGLPKHVLTLLDKLDPAEQLEYIAENRDALGQKPNAPNVNAKDGQAGGGDQKMTDAQKKELAAIYGVKPEYLPG